MRNILFSLLALAATAAYAQPQPQPNLDVCKLMSPEEMRMCLISKPGADVRSVRCDQVPASAIEKCLEQARRDDAPASAGATRDPKEDAKSDQTPEKATAPSEGTK